MLTARTFLGRGNIGLMVDTDAEMQSLRDEMENCLGTRCSPTSGKLLP
jgi:hypothetical protein